MSSANGANQALQEYEQIYQPKVFNVKGTKWTNWGYVLIGFSTLIMFCQALGIGPAEIWKRADDVTTVLFTLELLFRLYELDYEFFVGEERNWNFFDTLVVAISIACMVISFYAAQQKNGGHGSVAMSKMKVLRALRLLRLFRVFRALKSVEKINLYVESVLHSICVLLLDEFSHLMEARWASQLEATTVLSILTKTFMAIVITMAMSTLMVTVSVAVFAGGKAWLREHRLPELPKID